MQIIAVNIENEMRENQISQRYRARGIRNVSDAQGIANLVFG